MRGRFNIKSNKPQLFAIYRTPDGKLFKRPVKKERDLSKVYDGYVQAASGVYVPKILTQYIRHVGKKNETR